MDTGACNLLPSTGIRFICVQLVQRECIIFRRDNEPRVGPIPKAVYLSAVSQVPRGPPAEWEGVAAEIPDELLFREKIIRSVIANDERNYRINRWEGESLKT